MGYKPRQPKRIYYQQLSIRINELENKRQVKVRRVGGSERSEDWTCVVGGLEQKGDEDGWRVGWEE